MSISKKQKEAIYRYVKKHDRLEILLPKGAKEILREHVKLMNMSMTQYTDRALQLAIKHDRQVMAESNAKISSMHKPAKKTSNQ